MYENARIFHTNDLTVEDFYAGTLLYAGTLPDCGVLSGVIKNGSGSATMSVAIAGGGAYSGIYDQQITVQIYNVTGGKEVGSAKFRYRSNYTTAGSWDDTNLTTSTSATSLTALYGGSGGITVQWTQGTGDDFALNDEFVFYAHATGSLAKALDARRDMTSVAIETADPYYTLNLGASRRCTVCALFDVGGDLSGATYFRLQGTDDPGGAFTTVAEFDTSIDPMVLYFDATYQYWKITAHFSSAISLSIGQIFLGDYVELPAGAMFAWGSSEKMVSEFLDSQVTDYPRYIKANRREFRLHWENVSTSHRAIFDNLLAAARQNADRMERPIFIHLTPDDDGATLYWMKLVGDFEREWTGFGRDTVDLHFQEVAANYAV